MWDSKNFPFPVPQNTLFLSRGNGSVRSKRSKGRRKKERENRRETRRALCTDDRKEIGRDPRAASRTITNEIASLGLSTPLPSLCVSYATASRATTAPNKIQSRRGREIITRLIGDGRNGRGSSSIRIQSQSPPGRGNFAFRSLGCLGWGISRNDRLPFRLPLIIIARFVAYSYFIRSSRFVKWSDEILFFFFRRQFDFQFRARDAYKRKFIELFIPTVGNESVRSARICNIWDIRVKETRLRDA